MDDKGRQGLAVLVFLIGLVILVMAVGLAFFGVVTDDGGALRGGLIVFGMGLTVCFLGGVVWPSRK
jgi:hypothetical protein